MVTRTITSELEPGTRHAWVDADIQGVFVNGETIKLKEIKKK